MTDVFHALVLSLHQPPGNLEYLLRHDEWAAKEILFAIDRIPRSLWSYEDIARVHLALSGTLLETLSHPLFQNRVCGIIDCGAFLEYLQNTRIFELLGTGYYHPVLPLIPRADWDDQLQRWQGIARYLFNRPHFSGFWPPEMGFCMEMIPLLRRYGYRYALVDSEHVESVTPMDWWELRYRPHIARFGGEEITVVVRDRDLSNAQESGMDATWFINQVQEKTRGCGFAPLVTTCSTGENGNWFRNTTPGNNFWTAFYQRFLERSRQDNCNIKPVFISDYLQRHGTYGEVSVGPGAWNTGWHNGKGFLQWTGSPSQRAALTRVAELSQAIRTARRNAAALDKQNADLLYHLDEALWHVLRAETSCNFFWGETWVPRCHNDLDTARYHLECADAAFRDGQTNH
jgi:alpha-amylase/alpha-mannosidase (GH57 family)